MEDRTVNILEDEFYSDANYDNYDLAEWARKNVPLLLEEIKECHKTIRMAVYTFDQMEHSPERDRMIFNILRGK